MLLIAIIIFLLLSALFSGTEIAFVSASKLVVELKKKKGTRRGQIIAKFFERPSQFLGTMLVGNNIALVAFTALMTIPLTAFFQTQFHIKNELLLLFINTIVITIVVLIFGEFLPKTLFRLYADRVLYFLAFPLQFFRIILLIPAWIMTKLSNGLLRLFFRISVDEVEEPFTRLDLENFIKSSRTEADDDIDTEMFEKALNLHDTKVKEAMVPRPEIVSLDVSNSVQDLIDLIENRKMSRILIMEDDIDNILGYVHHQQLLFEPKSVKDIEFFDIPFIPETMRVRDLMNHFIKNNQSIACVVDEFGGTAGVITFEDILEEIFGEIEDEHDDEEYIEEEIAAGEYLFSGRLELDYLNEKYPELDLPEDSDYHTLSGYLVMTTGNLPEQNEEIILGKYKFTVILMSDTKIETIRVSRLDDLT